MGCGHLTASEDDYVDQFTGCFDRGGVLEWPGRYSLVAEFAAYLNRIVSDVVVQADQHHVQPVYEPVSRAEALRVCQGLRSFGGPLTLGQDQAQSCGTGPSASSELVRSRQKSNTIPG